MTIRTIVIALVAILSLLLLGESGVDAYRAWQTRQEAASFLEINRMTELLLGSAGDWAVERGATNAALNGDAPASAEQRAELAKRREAADGRFRAGLAVLRNLTRSPVVTRAADDAESAVAKLAAIRGKVDENIARGRTERPAEVITAWVPTITEAIERTTRLRLIAEIVADAPEARLARLMQMRHLVAEMAEYAGRERAAIAGLIAGKRPLAAEGLRALSQNRGRVDSAWSIV
jgi:methyl-accepting chemotaxis protein